MLADEIQRFRFTCSENDAPLEVWNCLCSNGQSGLQTPRYRPSKRTEPRHFLYRKFARPFPICGSFPLGSAETNETKQGRVIPTRMATTKTTPQTHTITEAAKKLGISRQAVHKAIRRGLLEAERATITETIVGESQGWVVTDKALKDYEVSLSHQERGKKFDLGCHIAST